MSDIRDLLTEFVLGTLADDDVARVEHALSKDPTLAAERAEIGAAVSSLSFMAPATAAADSSLRARMLASAGESGRFLPFLDRLAELFDVTADKAKEFLALIDEADAWTPLTPNISFHDYDGGPAVAGSRVGIVRVAAGHEFPMHRHKGQEVVLVLQGATQDGGTIYRAGDVCTKEDGTAHVSPALGSQELIYAVVVPNVEIHAPGSN